MGQTVGTLAVDAPEGAGLFETVEDDVLGERMEVLRYRVPSLRAVLDRSRQFGELDYLVLGDRRVSYAQHHALVAATAAVLRDDFGVGPGDRVAILAANRVEWVVTFWATVSLGAIAVGMNGWWAGDEIRYGIADADPAVLVADQRRLDRLGGDDPGVPLLRIDDIPTSAPTAASPDTLIAEDDPAVILYTSGTTGRPKGAVLSHRGIVAQLGIQTKLLADRLGMSPRLPSGARPYLSSPMFHVSGLTAGVVYGLSTGATHVLHEGRFDPAVVLEAIERERCTAISMVPTTAWRLVNHPDVNTRDLSSLLSVGGGAAPISEALQQRLREVFPAAGQRLGWGYGSTETGTLVSTAGPAELLRNPASCGRPLPTIQVEIRDANAHPVPDGEEGEICVRSALCMLEYWRNPDATAATIGPGRWLRTGDMGALVDGELVLSSRRTDLILRGGENVYPIEIEHVLEANPAIAECVVVGVRDEELGQKVKAVVVLKPGAGEDAASLRTWVTDRLAAFKAPELWELRNEPLPRTATGKVIRRALDDGETGLEEE